MARSLKLYVTGLVSLSAIALVLTSFVFALHPDVVFSSPPDLIAGMRAGIALDIGQPHVVEVFLGLAFWIALTLFAGAMPVRMPRGTMVSVAMAPIVASM